jgi:hypothetical protein
MSEGPTAADYLERMRVELAREADAREKAGEDRSMLARGESAGQRAALWAIAAELWTMADVLFKRPAP